MTSFILNDEIISTDSHPGMTLLDFIRESKSLKGTKIGCREGDCGACSVLVGSLEKNTVNYKSITSCISPLGNAQGKHIVTIEGINLNKKLTPVQEAMVDCNGTQCGFCTPGFVVSLTGFALKENNSTLGSYQDAVSGNICRCTGYKSIEKAGERIHHLLAPVNANDQLTWLVQNEFVPKYFLDIGHKLKELTLEKQSTWGKVVANGTDLFVHDADKLTSEEIHLVANKRSLHGIEMKANTVSIGANSTVTDLLDSKLLGNEFPQLAQHFKLVSSDPIRNMGTIGGNFVNASPIGDMSIFFLALESTLYITSDKGDRRLDFKDFHQDYKKYDLKEGDLVKCISFQKLENDLFNFEKVSKRTHLDIASVNGAMRIELDGEVISKISIAVGGVAAIPKYLKNTGAYLQGKALKEEIILEAEKVMQEEISPISDVRGSSVYKRLLARQLFFAHFLKLFPAKFSLKNLTQPT